MKGSRADYVQCRLSAPILLLVAGDADENTFSIIEQLSRQTVTVELGRCDTLVAELKGKNVSYPDTIRASYIPCHSIEEFLLLRQRLLHESQLFYFTCYSVIVLIDVKLNRTRFNEIKKQMSIHLHDSEPVGFVYYRAPVKMAAEYSKTTHLAFARNKIESILDGVNNFAETFVMEAFETQIKTNVVRVEKRRRKNVEQIIEVNSLWFCSLDRSEVIDKFVECLKDLDDTKDSDPSKLGALYETMGLFYREENSEDAKPERIFDAIPSLPNRYPPINQAKDWMALLGAAVLYYSKHKGREKMIPKVVDVMLRFVDGGCDEWVDECADTIRKNMALPLMDTRAWELISLVEGAGRLKKAAFLADLFATDLKGEDQKNSFMYSEQKIDFMLEAVRLLTKQSAGDVIMKSLCMEPRMASLVMLDPPTACKLIFNLLSVAGPVLEPSLQHRLFCRLYDCGNITNLRIPCELGFQVGECGIVDLPLKIHKVEKGTESKGPFLYSFFGKNKGGDNSSVEVGVGWDVRVCVEIITPFSIDLYVNVLFPDTNCEHVDVPILLPKRGSTKVELSLKPLVPGEVTIDTIECLIYQGYQRIPLQKPLKITAFENTVSFTYRTDLPLEQTMNLFDGECLRFNIWVTNDGTIPIDKLEIRGNGLDWVSDIALPLNPFDECLIQLRLTILATMKELDFTIVAGSNMNDLQSVIAVHQPMSVETAVVISSIEPVSSLPEIDTGFANLMFLAVDISNFSSSVFDYVASFANAAQTSLDFEGIVTEKEKTGILASYQTTAFIVAIEKETLRIACEKADPRKVINAVKQEEERKNRKISSAERPEIKKRVGIATLIEESLQLKWACGGGRCGTLMHNNALPSPETLRELSRTRPKTTFFVVNTDMDNVKCDQNVELVVKYDGVKITRCSLLLGVNMDPDYGVAWDGSLDQRAPDGADEFHFNLYFIQPGKFDLQIEYETVDNVLGKSALSITSHK